MNQQQRLEYWQVFDRFRKSRETLYAPKIARVLNAQKQQFIEQYKAGEHILLSAAPLKALITDLYFDAAITFGAKVRANLTRQQSRQKARMPIGFNERMQQLIEQYYGVDFLNMSQDITDTTRGMLYAILTKAQNDGLGFDDIVKLLDQTPISPNRARLIARTETVTAANSGAFLAAKESGIKLKKIWIATKDNRTRRDHAHVSTAEIDEDEAFAVGAYEMMHPGIRRQPNGLAVPAKEVVNCRCVIAHVPQRDASGRVIRN
jgi:hypothetical protein